MSWDCPWEDVTSDACDVVIPDCGMPMRKVRKHERAAMSDYAVRIQRMLETGVGGLVSEDKCLLCEHGSDDVSLGLAGDVGPIRQCSFCLLNIHDRPG